MDGAALGSLSQRFSTRGDPLTPRGQLPQSEMALVATLWGRGRYWHRAGGGQGCS